MQPEKVSQREQVRLDGPWKDSGLEELWQVPLSSAASLISLLHDTRNLVASIGLYCDLIDVTETGIRLSSARPYAAELRLIANASQQLLARMTAIAAMIDHSREASQSLYGEQVAYPLQHTCLSEGAYPVESFAGEVKANQSLLSALAGPGISIAMTLSGGNEPIALSVENLSRILINLTRNSAEAMRGKGRILISLEQVGANQTQPIESWSAQTPKPFSRSQGLLRLTFADSGPGIVPTAIDAVFAPGYTTHLGPSESSATDRRMSGQPGSPISDYAGGARPVSSLAEGRGLGLAVVQSLVNSAGGTVRALSHASFSPVSSAPDAERLAGAAIVLEFPILSTRSQPAQSETNVPWPLPANAASSGVQAAT